MVRAFVHETPGALHQAGPHGISLLDHAKKGGSAEMVGYLRKLLEPEKTRAKAKAKTAVRNGKPKRRKAA